MKYFLKKYKITLSIIIILIIISKATIVGSLFITSYLIDSISSGNFSKFIFWFSIDLLLIISSLIFGIIRLNYMSYFFNKIKSEIRIEVFNSIINMDLVNFNEKAVGHYVSLLQDDVKGFVNKRLQMPIRIFEFIFLSLIIFILVIFFSWIVSIEIFLFVALSVIIPFTIKKKIIKNENNIFKEINLYNEKKFKALGLFQTTYVMNKMNNHEIINNTVIKEYLNKNYEYSKKRLFINLPSIMYSMLSQALGGSILAIFLYLGYITIGQLASITFLQGMLYTSLGQLSSLIPNFLSGKNFANKLGFNMKKSENNIFLKNIINIDIEKFNIQYNGGFKNNINIKFLKNKKYLVIGKSGIGKSTMLKSIIGIEDTYYGNIFMNDNSTAYNLKKINNKNILKNINFIGSNPYIFNGTLMENIALFDENIDIERLKNILKIVKINTKKIDIKINVNNKSLSEGQKQKISIARVLYFNSNFLILDEALSHVDASSYKNIMLHLLKKDTLTLLNCSHNIKIWEKGHYDKILLLKK